MYLKVAHPSATCARQLLLNARTSHTEGVPMLSPTIEQLLSPPNMFGAPMNPMFMNGYVWGGES